MELVSAAPGGGLGAQGQGPGPTKWEGAILCPLHRGCEGVGEAACLGRSRQGAHSWESHVVPMRLLLLCFGGVTALAAAQPQSGANSLEQGDGSRGCSSSMACFPL